MRVNDDVFEGEAVGVFVPLRVGERLGVPEGDCD